METQQPSRNRRSDEVGGGQSHRQRANRAGAILRSAPVDSVPQDRSVAENQSDQVGGKIDFNRSERDQFFARYAYSTGYNINPFSVRGRHCRDSPFGTIFPGTRR